MDANMVKIANRVLGVVTVYHPDQFVFSNIQSYSNLIGRLIVYDNSESPSFFLANQLKSLKHVDYVHDGGNKGIAKRLNQALSMGKSQGFDWLLTMDQDSSFYPGHFERYLCLVQTLNSGIAMAGVVQNEEDSIRKDANTCQQDTILLITSGSMVNIAAADSLSGFNEDLFIDEVDYEFCYRAKLSGFQLVQFNCVSIRHQLGSDVRGFSIKSLKKDSRKIASPIRVYYILRNHLLMRSRYMHHFPQVFKERNISIFHGLKNNLIFNKQRLSVLKMIWKAIIDYQRGRFGKMR